MIFFDKFPVSMRKGAIILIVSVLALLGLFLMSSERSPKVPRDTKRLSVVTTFVPLYVFTKNVAGSAASVENLLPGGVGPHEYAPTPSDVARLGKADVIIKQGGIDDWVDILIMATTGKDRRIIVAGSGIAPHTGPPGITLNGQTVVSSPTLPLVKPTSDDPHVWLDPFLAVREVERIRDGLMAADPTRREVYARNAEVYMLQLLELDHEIRGALGPLTEREFVTFHPAFRYFAYEYELVEVAAIEEVPGEEPSPAQLVRLADEVKKRGVRVIFSEPQFSPRIVETLARDYGLRIATLDPLETGELRADYYEEVMRKNAQAIVEALR